MERRKKRSVFDKISGFFFGLLQKSFIGKFFTSYENANSRFLKITRKSKSRHVSHKNAFVRALERNVFARIIPKIFHALLRVAVRNYAVFMFTMGLAILPQYFLNRAKQSVLGYVIPGSFAVLVLSIVLMVTSLPFLFYGKSLAQALMGNKLFSFFAFKLFGIDGENILNVSLKKRVSKASVALILGALIGFTSYFVNPFIFLGITLAILFAYNVFRTPENGVILIIFTLPFATPLILKISIVYVFFCYMIKIILRKRVYSFEYLDLWAIIVVAVMLICGIDYQNIGGSLPTVLSHLVILASYFLCSNLVRSRTWFRKCIFALTASAVITAIIGIAQFSLGMLTGIESLKNALSFFEQYKYSIPSTFASSDIFAQYLIIAIPFGSIHLFSGKKVPKFGSFVVSVLLITALILTNSQYAYIGFIASLILILVFYNRNSIYLALIALASGAGLYFLFSNVGVLRTFADNLHIFDGFDLSEKLDEIGNGFNAVFGIPEIFGEGVGGASLYCDSFLIQLLLEYGIFTLIAITAFAIMFSRLVLSHCSVAKKKSRKIETATGLCALLGLLVTGIFKNVWYDEKIMLVIVIFIALSVAFVKREKNSEYVMDQKSDLTKASLDLELAEEDLHEYSSRRKYVHAPRSMKKQKNKSKIKLLSEASKIIRIPELEQKGDGSAKKKKKRDIYDEDDESESINY